MSAHLCICTIRTKHYISTIISHCKDISVTITFTWFFKCCFKSQHYKLCVISCDFFKRFRFWQWDTPTPLRTKCQCASKSVSLWGQTPNVTPNRKALNTQCLNGHELANHEVHRELWLWLGWPDVPNFWGHSLFLVKYKKAEAKTLLILMVFTVEIVMSLDFQTHSEKLPWFSLQRF